MFMEHPVDPCMESYIRVVHILGSWGQIVIRTFHIKIMRVWNCTKFCKAKGQNSISTRNKDTCLVWVLKEGFSISEPFELQTSSTSKSCQIFLNVMSSFPSHLPPSWFHSFILVLINLYIDLILISLFNSFTPVRLTGYLSLSSTPVFPEVWKLFVTSYLFFEGLRIKFFNLADQTK